MELTEATKARLRSPTTQRFAARHPQLAAEAKLMQRYKVWADAEKLRQESAVREAIAVEKQRQSQRNLSEPLRDRGRKLPPPGRITAARVHEIARAADGVPLRLVGNEQTRKIVAGARGNPMNERQRALVTLVKSRALFRGHSTAPPPSIPRRPRPSPGLAQPPMRYSERAEQLSADGALALAAVAANAARARSDAAARTRDVRDRAFGLEPSNVMNLGLDHIGNDRRESCPPAAAYGDGERRAALDAVANHAARARGRAVSRERAEDNAWRRAHIKA